VKKKQCQFNDTDLMRLMFVECFELTSITLTMKLPSVDDFFLEFPNMTVMTIDIHSETPCSSRAFFHRGHVTVKLVIACSVTFVLHYMPLMFDMQTLCLESGFEFLL